MPINATPMTLADNLFETVALYPSHVVTVSGEVAGHEAAFAFDGLRDLTSWQTPDRVQAEHARVDCGQPTPASTIFLDRAHNLDDEKVFVERTEAESNPVITQLTADSLIAAVSDGVDVRTLTVDGLDAAGAAQSEAIVLNGATEVVGAKTFSKILKCTLSAVDGARTVTVKQGSAGPTRATLGPNVTETWKILLDKTVRADVGGTPSGPDGCRTHEGAWWATFTEESGTFWQARVAAPAAARSLVVTGLSLGKRLEFKNYLHRPVDSDRRRMYWNERRTPGGVRVRDQAIRHRVLDDRITLYDEPEYVAGVRKWVTQVADGGVPFWWVLDQTNAPDEAWQFLNMATDVVWAFEQAKGRTGRIMAEENVPVPSLIYL